MSAPPTDWIEQHNIISTEGQIVFIYDTDLDEEICITNTKSRIGARPQDGVIISVKKIEAWFLACSPTMEKLLAIPKFTFANPEDDKEPFETINQLLTKHAGRGVGKKKAGKIKLVSRMIELGFDLSDAAANKNCPSARYFLKKLTEIGTTP